MTLKIFTSFFANQIDGHPITKDPRAVAIARWSPFEKVRRYEKLMPTLELLIYFKTHDVSIAEGGRLYRKKVLASLNPKQVLKELKEFSIPWPNPNQSEIFLLCWCHDNRVCHRNIVARWLRRAGIEVKELPDDRPDREKAKDPMYEHFMTSGKVFTRWL